MIFAGKVGEGKSTENPAAIKHIDLNLLKQEKSCKLKTGSKRKKAGWDENYLLRVLKGGAFALRAGINLCEKAIIDLIFSDLEVKIRV